MPISGRRFAATVLAALVLAPAAAAAQSFYSAPDTAKQRRLDAQTQEEARRQRIAARKERLAADAAERQFGARPTDRDTIVLERRYGNAIPNRQGDTGSTTIQSTGNRSLLVPQR